MNSDSKTEIRLAFRAGDDPQRVAVAVATAAEPGLSAAVLTDSEARSDVDFLSVL